MIDLSTMSPAELRVHVMRVERRNAYLRVFAELLSKRLFESRVEGEMLLKVIARQVVEHTEMRRQIANLTELLGGGSPGGCNDSCARPSDGSREEGTAR